MTQSRRPTVVPFDVRSGGLPAVLAAGLSRSALPGSLLLLAGRRARASGWAPQAAVALADAMQKSGRATLLVDLELRAPALHRQIDVPNVEGLADVFEFGTSPRRVTQPVPRHDFRFLPAGAYVSDPGELLRSPQWSRVVADVEAEAVLFYAAADEEELAPLAGRIGEAVLLVEEEEVGQVYDQVAGGVAVSAVLIPAVPTELAARRSDSEEYAASWTRAGVGTTPPPPRLEQGGDLPWTETLPEEKLLAEPPAPIRARKRRSAARVALLAAAALLLIGGVGYAALWGAQKYLDVDLPLLGDGDEAPPAVASQPSATEGPQAAQPTADSGPPAASVPGPVPLAYSVAVEAHRDLGLSLRRARALRRAANGIGFFVAPTVRDSAVFYRVMAGPVADSTGAAALMQRLVDEGHKTDVEPWAVRRTRFAFDLGEFDSEAAAERRREEVAALRIPAYVVRMSDDDGAPYRVYAGAYEGAGEAEVMNRELKRAGINAKLVARTGRPAA